MSLERFLIGLGEGLLSPLVVPTIGRISSDLEYYAGIHREFGTGPGRWYEGRGKVDRLESENAGISLSGFSSLLGTILYLAFNPQYAKVALPILGVTNLIDGIYEIIKYKRE